eukprot:CAMPEP_0182438064 /NCGR_PEP_ID=MMETSP1167-20130531/85486_1 /TAXON_ID=2988 /ORGANISM="Mallomonas Sp, Strain CCMP3275" /LENGTH=123 /DNA_ID=CAMNT_0024631235 /DNA_START=603 /DNA_END=974 /DNA_ORIENTATION=-
MLFAGDTIGHLTVWVVPEHGVDYEPNRSSKIHHGAIRCIESTWKHLITASDDGLIILHELTTLTQIRTIDIAYWTFHKHLITNENIPRRIKSMHIVEDFESGGSMVIGTSYGEIMISSIGMYV